MYCRLLILLITITATLPSCRTSPGNEADEWITQLDNPALTDSQKLVAIAAVDSLAGTVTTDSLRLLLHRKAGAFYLNKGEPLKAKNHFLQAVELARLKGDTANLAAALNNAGIAFDDLFETDSAIQYYTAASQLYIAQKDSVRYALTLINIAILYKNKGHHHKAIDTAIAAASLLEHTNDTRSLSDAYTTLGNSLKSINQFDQALTYHQKALQLRQADRDSSGLAGTLNNIGNIYRYQKKYEEALEQYFKALAIKERTGTQKSIATTIDNIATTYLDLRQMSKAGRYFQQALSIRQKIDDKEGIVTSINRLCRLHIEMGDLATAEKLALEAEPLSHRLDYLKQRVDNLAIMTEVLQRKGKYEPALRYALQSLQLKDSLFDNSMAQAISEAETRFRTHEKEQQLSFVNALKARQDIDLANQKILIAFLAGLLLLLLATLYLLTREKNKATTLFRELGHRVDNNLQTLLGLIILKKHALADPAQQQLLTAIEERVQAMASIHHLLQPTVYNKKLEVNMHPFITRLLQNIEKTFLPDPASFRIQASIMPVKFDSKTAVTIGLLINELLTNIFKHGETDNTVGEIVVALSNTGKKYTLTITDNCRPWKNTAHPGRTGMGLFLIDTLASQLNAKINRESSETGNCTVLRF
ncbi:MAG: tetratricopeptide repeat protein [Chitinophagaceae bacterium]|nr:tetratricopeptide repeat protein [Chitinophagaceae bacterium]